jgi:NADPH-dependent glutamate synthase beta subunit-like oxidoreductase
VTADLLDWGFSVVLLAVGAWRDRPLAIPGIEQFEGKGFYYQNPFVSWFNQYHAPNYEGPDFEICDGAMVVGGGLSSVDVAKILMLETTQRALLARGISVDVFTLERKGIPRVLKSVGVAWEDLGLRGCTLYYRRRAIDMPLVPTEEGLGVGGEEQAKRVRQKLLANAQAKYLFHFEPCRLPVDLIVEGDRLAGLVFCETKVTEQGVEVLPGTEFERKAPLVISSIGSLPEGLTGLPMRRQLFPIDDPDTGKLNDFHNVFALGNAVTGRGNIRASRIHARKVTEIVMDDFLNWRCEDYERLCKTAESGAESTKARGGRWIKEKKLRSEEEIRKILERAADYQRMAGYDGTYMRWVAKHRPVRLEEMHAP